MTTARQTDDTAVLTRRFALNRTEAVTICAAAVVSTGAYLSGGQPYLARGVVGDLTGFATLAAVPVRTHRRLRHGAALCLTAIGTVLLIDPLIVVIGSPRGRALRIAAGVSMIAAGLLHRRNRTGAARTGGLVPLTAGPTSAFSDRSSTARSTERRSAPNGPEAVTDPNNCCVRPLAWA